MVEKHSAEHMRQVSVLNKCLCRERDTAYRICSLRKYGAKPIHRCSKSKIINEECMNLLI